MKTQVSLLALSVALTGAASAQDPDPRTNLAEGLHDAGQAAWNMELIHAVEPPPGFFDPDALFAVPSRPAPEAEQDEAEDAEEADDADSGEDGDGAPAEADDADTQTEPEADKPTYTPLALANSDIAFDGARIYVGNFHGFHVYEAGSDDAAPERLASVVCPGGQNDVSVYGDYLFMSVEQNRARIDCGGGGAEGDVNAERFRGIRIFDISDLTDIRQVGAVQTCRGSHTHTLLPDPEDENILYIYNQGTAGVRPGDELEGCSDADPEEDADTALYSIDIIEVPLDAPEEAAIVNRPRIFADKETGEIAGLWRGGAMGVATQRTASTNHCHDITVYPELGLAAGACSGNGILLDISDPVNPARISELFDPDMAYWHSATFSNDGETIVFTDEWGGGIGARCRAEDPEHWGANLIAEVTEDGLAGRSFHKLPADQGPTENCVAHNGNLVPVPGRDIFVQSWYQGGISVMDFTDPEAPFEIAYFDRGPIDADQLYVAGHWSAYWHNGRIYGAEIARGLDVLRLLPSEHLSAAELIAAEQVRDGRVNPQTQTRIEWADTPAVAQSYLDQLNRDEALERELAERAAAELARWAEDRPRRGRLARLAQDLSAIVADADAAASEEDSEDADAAMPPRTRERITALAGVLERVSG